MDYLKKIIFILIAAFASFFQTGHAYAASLSISPSAGSYGPGDSIVVDVFIDDIKECINTVYAELEYPSDYLNVVEFIEGESIINIWLDKPGQEEIAKANSAGKIVFSGGIPGGYCGRIPGDPGRSNVIARLVFTVPGMIISEERRDEVAIEFTSATKVLLNDGYGTEDMLTASGAAYAMLSGSGGANNDGWKDQIREDLIRPEPFVIELRRDSDMFEGKYYINFYTTDKQSGMDRYEVLEIRPGQTVGVADKQAFWERVLGRDPFVPGWKQGNMPYLLDDQDLLSTIKVKAVDKAGNERYVEYVPPEDLKVKPPQKSYAAYYIAAGGVFVLLLASIIYIIIRKKSHAKTIISDDQAQS